MSSSDAQDDNSLDSTRHQSLEPEPIVESSESSSELTSEVKDSEIPEASKDSIESNEGLSEIKKSGKSGVAAFLIGFAIVFVFLLIYIYREPIKKSFTKFLSRFSKKSLDDKDKEDLK